MPLSAAAATLPLPACEASDVVLLDSIKYNAQIAERKGVTPLEAAKAALQGAGVRSVIHGPGKLDSEDAPFKVAREVAQYRPRVVVVHYSAFDASTVGTSNDRLGDFFEAMKARTDSRPPVYVVYSAALPDRKLEPEKAGRANELLARLIGIPLNEVPKRAYYTKSDRYTDRFRTPQSIAELREGVMLGLRGRCSPA